MAFPLEQLVAALLPGATWRGEMYQFDLHYDERLNVLVVSGDDG